MPGIIAGMFSYPRAVEVLADLGDKAVEALSRAVAGARRDLAHYQSTCPEFAATSSVRTLASFIHDRIWERLVAIADVAGLYMFENGSGPTHEIIVDGLAYVYRIRIKRHNKAGQVSTYPTQSALDFLEQSDIQQTLDGRSELRLIVGYYWETDTHQMGAAVISLRDGINHMIWLVELEEPSSGPHTTDPHDPRPPQRPRVGLLTESLHLRAASE